MGSSPKATILIADDHPLFRQGLRLLLEGEDGFTVVGEAGDGQEAIDRVRKSEPDIVVMDVSMPGMGGIEATRKILSVSPAVRVVALSMHTGERFVVDMLRAGAAGYVVKESAPEELVRGIRAVVSGEMYLSPAVTGALVGRYLQGGAHLPSTEGASDPTDEEWEILELVADGNSGKEIAMLLQLSVATVESAQQRLVGKLGAGSVANLPEAARERRHLGEQGYRRGRLGLSQTILRTKLHRPALPADLVRRTDLLERLSAYDRIPLTLVSAPAGYGKSVLAASWLEICPCRSAWLSLGDEENEFAGFLAYVVAAIQSIFPDACEGTQALLDAGGMPPTEIFAESLINDLDRVGESFILVLDDLHLIHAQPVHDLLSRLLEHPPLGFHLVLCTRRDPPLPLGRLRAHGRLNEISAGHLRFSRAETAEFLRQTGDLSVDEEALAKLDELIEGWPAGLRLVVNAMVGRGDLARILESMQGRESSSFEYLATEVLSSLPPAIEELVLATSILDRFSAPLCRALAAAVGGQDGEPVDGRGFLAALREHNLFLVGLDPENLWFRYHHLFQQVLLSQLKRRAAPDRIRALHACAGAWFAENGLVEEAIRHTLAAGEPAGAARLVEESRQTLLNNDRWFVLERWMSLLPEESIREHPGLLMARTWIHYHHFDLQAIPEAIAAAESLLCDSPAEDPVRGEIDFFRGYIHYFTNEGARALECFERARSRVPENHQEIRAQNELLRALSLQMVGRKEEAVEEVSALLSRRSGSKSVARTRLQVALVFLHIISGDLGTARAANQTLLEFATRRGFSNARAWAVYLRGLIHYYRNELPEAIRDFREAESQRYVLHTRAIVDSLIGLVLSYQATGDADSADTMLDSLREYAATLEDPAYSALTETAGIRLSLMRGESGRAAEAAGAHRSPVPENMIWWLEIPGLTRCRLLLADGGDAALNEARERLIEAVDLNEANHNVCHLIETLILLACVHERQGRERDALAVLQRAVSLAEGGGFLRPFLEQGRVVADLMERMREEEGSPAYVRKILAAFREEGVEAATAGAGGSGDEHQQPGAGLLTDREREVLSLVEEGLANKQIAAKLYISGETVKKHLYNTYRKLGADGRITAVARARELGILRNRD